MLGQGLSLSGEGKAFFIHGRLNDLRRRLPATFHPRRILDFGCGTGDTAPLLAACFPSAEVVGCDASAAMLDRARRAHGSARISFCEVAALDTLAPVDLCYCNGVFHHIPPAERPGALSRIRGSLRPGGYFALFENNPYNPGTRLVMHRIPFDRGARMLSPRTARRLLAAAGFEWVSPPRFLFCFPRCLAPLRRLEHSLAGLPLGAQYGVLARRER